MTTGRHIASLGRLLLALFVMTSSAGYAEGSKNSLIPAKNLMKQKTQSGFIFEHGDKQYEVEGSTVYRRSSTGRQKIPVVREREQWSVVHDKDTERMFVVVNGKASAYEVEPGDKQGTLRLVKETGKTNPIPREEPISKHPQHDKQVASAGSQNHPLKVLMKLDLETIEATTIQKINNYLVNDRRDISLTDDEEKVVHKLLGYEKIWKLSERLPFDKLRPVIDQINQRHLFAQGYIIADRMYREVQKDAKPGADPASEHDREIFAAYHAHLPVEAKPDASEATKTVVTGVIPVNSQVVLTEKGPKLLLAFPLKPSKLRKHKTTWVDPSLLQIVDKGR